ncbi:MAG TPA: hypothetical protein ENH92_00440 [Ectothiorhodospiraceae bacterium]|nr:hypothetical protein [Ectothiorhodospiraceae bacterium]
MGYSIHFDADTGILTVTQVGAVTFESRRKLLDEILTAIPEEGELKVLSDLRQAEVSMSSDEAIKYGELIVQGGHLREAKIAMVHPIGKENNYLTESVVLLDGDTLRLVTFTSMQEACQWLSES